MLKEQPKKGTEVRFINPADAKNLSADQMKILTRHWNDYEDGNLTVQYVEPGKRHNCHCKKSSPHELGCKESNMPYWCVKLEEMDELIPSFYLKYSEENCQYEKKEIGESLPNPDLLVLFYVGGNISLKTVEGFKKEKKDDFSVDRKKKTWSYFGQENMINEPFYFARNDIGAGFIIVYENNFEQAENVMRLYADGHWVYNVNLMSAEILDVLCKKR